MRKRTSMLFTSRTLTLTGIIILTSYFIFGAATAHSSWWQKGVDLLKSPAGTTAQQALSSEDIGAGLKEALLVGSQNVVSQLGRPDGFNLDPAIHIPLPQQLNNVKSLLGKVGMSSMLDDLELKLNRAAEVATPKAKELFAQAISEMTFEDVMNIYNGPDDAATRYFQEKMTPPLAREMQPVVDQSLAEVGAVQAYDNVMGEYRAIPFVPDVKADLTTYVVEKGMDGIFHYIALEEAAIRQNPAKRTTELLQRVFGAK
ncbi:MAG: DUF4197 domain-containing protein [Desulfobulbaceae bacterium]|jgi:hypothetical protein|nr:DUF4197 domain-containing protein [Desulfobulbaceae bacterium]MDH3782487.1 DUF4197 domain-containing protein [Desulfobulbaceae bacterium]